MLTFSEAKLFPNFLYARFEFASMFIRCSDTSLALSAQTVQLQNEIRSLRLSSGFVCSAAAVFHELQLSVPHYWECWSSTSAGSRYRSALLLREINQLRQPSRGGNCCCPVGQELHTIFFSRHLHWKRNIFAAFLCILMVCRRCWAQARRRKPFHVKVKSKKLYILLLFSCLLLTNSRPIETLMLQRIITYWGLSAAMKLEKPFLIRFVLKQAQEAKQTTFTLGSSFVASLRALIPAGFLWLLTPSSAVIRSP